jgi:PAS domain-containing protein
MRRQTSTEATTHRYPLNDIWDKSGVGIAVLNDRMQYEAVNSQLAHMHGIPAENHVGRHLREIIGDVALQVEPAIHRAFHAGRPVLNIQCSGVFPSAPEPVPSKSWVVSYFPARDHTGAVKRVGAIVVEVEPEEIPAGHQLHEQPGEVPPRGEVLRSWKEIANYVHTCVKTVQRWEQLFGLPIHRLIESKGSVVFAMRAEIDGWMQSRSRSGRSPASSGEMEAAFAYSPVPALVIDDDRLIVQANIAAVEMVQTARKDLIGRKLDSLAWGEKPDKLDYEWNLFLNTGRSSGIRKLKRSEDTPVSVEYIARKAARGINLITFMVVRNESASERGFVQAETPRFHT